jgi:hypothetical protein
MHVKNGDDASLVAKIHSVTSSTVDVFVLTSTLRLLFLMLLLIFGVVVDVIFAIDDNVFIVFFLI